ncbi:hypothetical protein [Kribbella sp. NPDC055071]
MVDWNTVVTTDFAVPEGIELRTLVDELAEMLTSADPVIRDEQAYSTLATWINRDLARSAGVRPGARVVACGCPRGRSSGGVRA